MSLRITCNRNSLMDKMYVSFPVSPFLWYSSYSAFLSTLYGPPEDKDRTQENINAPYHQTHIYVVNPYNSLHCVDK